MDLRRVEFPYCSSPRGCPQPRRSTHLTMGSVPEMMKLTRYAWLSFAASVCTVAFKAVAWALTDSVGLLSDALESLVNVGAAVMLLSMLRIAPRPADKGHAYGQTKAEST